MWNKDEGGSKVMKDHRSNYKEAIIEVIPT
jgi:hypothetical protein